MDELELLLRKNKLHILIIKAMHDCDKGKPSKNRLDALDTLKTSMETIHELAEHNRNLLKEVRKLRLNNALQTKDIVELKLKINTLEEWK
jgi:hypothetical protein